MGVAACSWKTTKVGLGETSIMDIACVWNYSSRELFNQALFWILIVSPASFRLQFTGLKMPKLSEIS